MKQIYKELRSTILVALVAFLVCWLSNVWLFPAARHHVDPDQWFEKELKLTDAQKKQLETVEQKYSQRHADLVAQIQNANQELAKVLVEEKKYTPRVKTASAHVDQLQAELKDVTLQHFYQMQPVLTPQQIEIMDQLVVHALSHHQ